MVRPGFGGRCVRTVRGRRESKNQMMEIERVTSREGHVRHHGINAS